MSTYDGFSVITDRTEADKTELLRVRAKIITETWEGLTEDEKTYWFSNPKGAYNISDLNRVGNNMAYLADLLNSYGYAVGISPKTDWVVDDIPTQSQMSQLLADLQALEDSYYTLTSTPAPPASMAKLFWYDANNIEQILLDINMLLENMIAQFKFSDTFYCGEV